MLQSPYRPLGATEQAVWLRDRATPLHFVLTAQVQGAIDSSSLTEALHRLQHHHPLLRVKIALESEGSPYFVEQAAPIPCRMVPRQGETQWQIEAAWELSQPFNWTEAPLIRVVLLHSPMVSELMVVCHHAIADGIAAVHLIQTLLSLLGNPQQVLANPPVPSAMESLLPHDQTTSRLQKGLGVGVLKLQQLWQCIHQTVNPACVANAPVQVKAGALSTETTAQLIHRCRQERTTVHAAICTAWLWAIAQNHNDSKQLFRCFSPINLRPYLVTPVEQACGVYIAPAQTTHRLTPQTQFWQTARSLKADLMGQVEANHQLKLARQHEILMSIHPSPEFVQHLFTQNCTSDVMVTNLGRLAIPQQYGALVLNAMYGPMVLSGFEPERVCGVITLGDRLFFTVVCQDSDSESVLIQQTMQTLELAIAAWTEPCGVIFTFLELT